VAVHVTEIELAFRADHPDRLTISYDLIRIQKDCQGDEECPLRGYDPEEVLISGPELLFHTAGLALHEDGNVHIEGRPTVFWGAEMDRSFACIAPMLRGTMVIGSGESKASWYWTFEDGKLIEDSDFRTVPDRRIVIKPFK